MTSLLQLLKELPFLSTMIWTSRVQSAYSLLEVTIQLFFFLFFPYFVVLLCIIRSTLPLIAVAISLSLRVFHGSSNWQTFTVVWITVSLLKIPAWFCVFSPTSTMPWFGLSRFFFFLFSFHSLPCCNYAFFLISKSSAVYSFHEMFARLRDVFLYPASYKDGLPRFVFFRWHFCCGAWFPEAFRSSDSFLIFPLSQHVWWCPLPIFPCSYCYPSLKSYVAFLIWLSYSFCGFCLYSSKSVWHIFQCQTPSLYFGRISCVMYQGVQFFFLFSK